jgi:hypothetical protein
MTMEVVHMPMDGVGVVEEKDDEEDNEEDDDEVVVEEEVEVGVRVRMSCYMLVEVEVEGV